MAIEQFTRIKCGLIFEGKAELKCLFGGIRRGFEGKYWMIVLGFEAKQLMMSETVQYLETSTIYYFIHVHFDD